MSISLVLTLSSVVLAITTTLRVTSATTRAKTKSIMTITTEFPAVTFGAFSKLITDANFGTKTSARVNGKHVKGRQLYKIKDSAKGNTNETTSAFRKELANRGPDWVLVGCVRKSITE
ncbi:hypothetical protein J3Q64DRAFT_1045095 [Phycomyces blakesleeanus]|uniref:Uncharacterized protein n=1 Tax=Phycomyces blakesleeanus TaxID=4837 RepID=A0ABR3BHS4_PHYBL